MNNSKSAGSKTIPPVLRTRRPSLSTPFILAIALFFCLSGNSSSLNATSRNNFPTFPIIQANVNFWEKIYTAYSTSEAVIHDNNDLTKIYEVIPILNHLQPGAAQINKPILKGAEQKYSTILSQLARGIPPLSSDERRIAAMYQDAKISRLQKASESVRAQIGQKDRFREGVARSATYLPQIKRIFRSYNLPEELAYLPHVESSFNPDAYSKIGAAGLWQFTRSTGKEYMRIDKTIDERRNPLISSHAAAKLLKRNYEVLGSWPLALTAYNYGTSGMMRAKKDQGTYEMIFQKYNEGHFKFASRNFYSEFLAALKSAKKMERNSAQSRQNPPKTINTIRLSSRASINTISRHYKVDIKTIKALNPALKSAAFQGESQLPQGFQLNLPTTVQNSKKQIATM